MPPRIGRRNYNHFRGNEVITVARELVRLVKRVRIHEKRKRSNGRPPFGKRNMIKCMLFIEVMRCPVPEAHGLLKLFKHVLRLKNVPKRSTIYKYRAERKMTRILEDLQLESSEELWKKETIAAVDSTGNSHSVGKAWSNDRSKPGEYRKYDKAHYVSGTKTSVIRATRLTRGKWHDSPELKPNLDRALPGSKIEAVAMDPGYVGVANYELVHTYGATPYIKPKDNAVFHPHPTNAYEASVLYATRFPRRWKSVYRWRTKAEAVNHAKKSRFPGVLRGGVHSRRNRELCQCIVHNLRFTLMDRYMA